MAENAQRPRPPPHRRRDKVQLSCDPCRHRKLKCDRQNPCGACLRRGLINSCNYVTIPSSTLPGIQKSVLPRQDTSLQDRILELESLVVTLMKGQSLPCPPPPKPSTSSSLSPADVHHGIRTSKKPREETEYPTDPGTLNFRKSGTSYVQSAHWEAILTKISGLKDDLLTDSKAISGSQLFYGPNRHATREEILAAVPPRPVVDRLMAHHFNSFLVTPYLIHSKKFLREYENFWKNCGATSIAWIGLMFSMLYIAAQLQTFATDFADERAESLKVEHLAMKDTFREKALQCLILARYTAGGPYILETLIMVLTGESMLAKSNASDGWLMISMILHLAMRMGYHRDPDHFPEISQFEGEMRRRLWATILQLDLALSLEMGLPRSAIDAHIDTKQPRNLRDCDFDEDTTKIPPPRPETEWTPVLSLIAKGRLTSTLGLICNINTDIKPPSYDEVLRIDALLEDMHNRAVPPVLRWEPMPHAITDSPSLVIQRISVETTYYKSRILLYRRALCGYQARQIQQRDRESVGTCVDSALKILSFQQTLYEESQPFGRLAQLRWKVNHIVNQNILLATSVLCLYLQDADKFEVPVTAGQIMWSPRAEEIRQELAISHKIWLQMSTTSPEAAKVSKALSIVLGNTEASIVDDDVSTSYDFLPDFDAIPLHGPGAMFNNQSLPVGFYSPLAFFDNVLETQET